MSCTYDCKVGAPRSVHILNSMQQLLMVVPPYLLHPQCMPDAKGSWYSKPRRGVCRPQPGKLRLPALQQTSWTGVLLHECFAGHSLASKRARGKFIYLPDQVDTCSTRLYESPRAHQQQLNAFNNPQAKSKARMAHVQPLSAVCTTAEKSRISDDDIHTNTHTAKGVFLQCLH